MQYNQKPDLIIMRKYPNKILSNCQKHGINQSSHHKCKNYKGQRAWGSSRLGEGDWFEGQPWTNLGYGLAPSLAPPLSGQTLEIALCRRLATHEIEIKGAKNETMGTRRNEMSKPQPVSKTKQHMSLPYGVRLSEK